MTLGDGVGVDGGVLLCVSHLLVDACPEEAT